GESSTCRSRRLVHQDCSLRTNSHRCFTLDGQEFIPEIMECGVMTTTAPRAIPMGTLGSRFLQLAERITTPLIPADYLDIIDPLRSGTRLRGRIVAIHPETRDAVSLVIKPGRGWRPYTPGQYVRIGVDVDGV